MTYAANHVAAATKQSQNVQSLHSEIQLQCAELIRNLQLLLSQMQVGDANITVVQNQIAALQ
jgi:hypothetical protein